MLVSVDGQKFEVKDCRGLSKYRGLMFDRLKGRDGALLDANSIWMLFTPVELDLIFIDKDKRVVDIQRAVPLTLNPKTWKVYKCPEAKWCLELKKELFKGRVGDQVLF